MYLHVPGEDIHQFKKNVHAILIDVQKYYSGARKNLDVGGNVNNVNNT